MDFRYADKLLAFFGKMECRIIFAFEKKTKIKIQVSSWQFDCRQPTHILTLTALTHDCSTRLNILTVCTFIIALCKSHSPQNSPYACLWHISSLFVYFVHAQIQHISTILWTCICSLHCVNFRAHAIFITHHQFSLNLFLTIETLSTTIRNIHSKWISSFFSSVVFVCVFVISSFYLFFLCHIHALVLLFLLLFRSQISLYSHFVSFVLFYFSFCRKKFHENINTFIRRIILHFEISTATAAVECQILIIISNARSTAICFCLDLETRNFPPQTRHVQTIANNN